MYFKFRGRKYPARDLKDAVLAYRLARQRPDFRYVNNDQVPNAILFNEAGEKLMVLSFGKTFRQNNKDGLPVMMVSSQ